MSEIQSVDQAMSDAARFAVDYAQELFGVTLDYSEASIEKVEEILSRIHDSIPKTPPKPTEQTKFVLQKIQLTFGGYIGEVIKRHYGGKWKTETSLYPGQKLLTFEIGSIDLWPQVKVGKRLEDGRGDDVWFYYRAVRDKFQKKT